MLVRSAAELKAVAAKNPFVRARRGPRPEDAPRRLPREGSREGRRREARPRSLPARRLRRPRPRGLPQLPERLRPHEAEPRLPRARARGRGNGAQLAHGAAARRAARRRLSRHASRTSAFRDRQPGRPAEAGPAGRLGLSLTALLRAPAEHIRESVRRCDAEQLVPPEPGTARRRARDSAQEAGALPRRSQRLRVRGGQHLQRVAGRRRRRAPEVLPAPGASALRR